MPKVRTLSLTLNNVKFEADLRVNSKGVFSAIVPDDKSTEVSEVTAEETERQWCKALRDFAARSKRERKVIAVRFVTSLIKENSDRDHFNRDQMMLFQALICLETTITQGDKVSVSYQEHPDFKGLHADPQPWPWAMQLDEHDIRRGSAITIIKWTPEIEALLVEAGKGILRIAEMLDQVLTTPEGILEATQRRLDLFPTLALPAPTA